MNSKKLPNFIIAGFPKCGSTSLYYYLNEHPEIFMPSQKELHFFTHEILNSTIEGPGDKQVNKFHITSFNEYKKCYSKVTNQEVIGDASPSYINYPSCISDLKDKLGDDVKIIVLLRDPVKRAYSNYLHLVREHRENLDFFSALKEEQNRRNKKYSDFWYYTFNSFYFEKIKAFKNEFKDVLIITTEEMSRETSKVITEVYSFLGVDKNFIPDNIERRYNPGGLYKENIITKFFFKQSKLRSLIKQVIPISPWMKHFKHSLINKYQRPTPPIDERSEDYLVELFSEDVLKLNSEFGVNTEFWNKKFITLDGK